MTRGLEIVANDENEIFDRLEDCLFWGDLSKDELECYMEFEAMCAVDENVARAITRATKIILNDASVVQLIAEGIKRNESI